MEVEPVFIAGGCNRSSSAISWQKSQNAAIAFCCSNLVLIGNADSATIESSLVGHGPDVTVNAVKWVQDGSGRLISGDSDGSINIWTYHSNRSYSLNATLTGHLASVTNLSVIVALDGHLLISSCASDGTVRLWRDGKCVQTIECTALPLCSALVIYQDRVFLAVGDVDAQVILYRLERDEQFARVAVLNGHGDWIRGLDFMVSEKKECVLASAAQDRLIRIWVFSDAESVHVSLESVLAGHDQGVLSVRWGPDQQLLSASMDKTMIIWSHDKDSDLWISMAQTGEVGGHNLACYCAEWSPDGNRLICNTYNGAFYLWSRTNDGRFTSSPIFSGHSSPVASLAWNPEGQYIISAGEEDQTTRIFSTWTHGPGLSPTFHEIGRPQMHGYDMSCVCPIASVAHRFASGAQEKVIRVFDAPRNFIQDLHQLSGVDSIEKSDIVRAENVFCPEIGLSNKAVSERDDRSSMTGPPDESLLMQDKLWPEVAKLYGHGNDVFAMTCAHDGTTLASSCSSKEPNQAAIILWSTSTWKPKQSLPIHSLTVVQIEFSHDDKFLLSVSRDRSIAISMRVDDVWKTTMCLEKTHHRIIWSCSWSHDDLYFATGSRDKKIHVWKVDRSNGSFSLDSTIATKSAVTAVAFTDDYLLGVGCEDGSIYIYKGQFGSEKILVWESAVDFPKEICHSRAVRALKWNPRQGVLTLASCSSDHTVRLFSIQERP
uniref:Elongator complex protein 2 n=1 Tax=Spongospora subterranea TaxID=70186 RepID=A0A0H5R8Z8_9EUKA|eukprot:CRZ10603.1 hypothetical protein [Spongospora subterranea]